MGKTGLDKTTSAATAFGDAKEKAIVVGGGAAGMMAAIMLSERGFETTLLEKNEKLGKKLFITGKGRCNFTNDCEPDIFFENVVSNPRFLYSALYGLTPQDVISLFESWGLETKVERGQRAFPASDHAYDVIDCLKRQLKKAGVRVELNTEVTGLLTSGEADGGPGLKSSEDSARLRVTGVRTRNKAYSADRVIIATGGLSYPTTGSTGDGYKWAESLGHTIVPCRPSLVALTCAEHDLAALQGLTLKNVSFTVKPLTDPNGENTGNTRDGENGRNGKNSKKKRRSLYSGFGEMLITHFGVTGPLVLTASARCGRALEEGPLAGSIDLKPAVPADDLDRDLTGFLAENANRDCLHAIRPLYPASFVPVLLDRAGIPAHKKAHDITREERAALVSVTKNFLVTLTGLRGYNEAVITQGGVSVKEVDPGTMASKMADNLYFAGEVLDVDALTGGFNLQIAWATGAAAGRA